MMPAAKIPGPDDNGRQTPLRREPHMLVQPVPMITDIGIETWAPVDEAGNRAPTEWYIALAIEHPSGSCVHEFAPHHWAEILIDGSAKLNELMSRSGGLEVVDASALEQLQRDVPPPGGPR